MEAIILAAGLGTRLRPYTENTPKPLLHVQGRPILDWILGALPPAVDRVVVVVHYLAEQIEAYLREQKHIPDHAVVHQHTPRGTGDAMRSCRGHLKGKGSFLVLNGDDLFGAADLAALAACPAGVLVHEVSDPRRYGIAFRNSDGTLEKLVEKPNMEGPALANVGVYVFPSEVFEIELKLSERGEYEITDYVTALARRGPFYPVQAKFWLPLGTIESWQAAEKVDLRPLHKG